MSQFDTIAITSFSKALYDSLGKTFIRTWWQQSKIPLHCVSEDENPGITLFNNFDKVCPQFNDFKEAVLKKNYSRKKTDKVIKWGKKAHTILYFLRIRMPKYIMWIDIDVLVKKKIPTNIADKLCGNSLLFGYEEAFKTVLAMETGLVIFNTKHQLISNLIAQYEDYYYKHKVLTLSKPYDGVVLRTIIDKTGLRKSCRLYSRSFRDPYVKPLMKHIKGHRCECCNAKRCRRQNGSDKWWNGSEQ